MKQSRSVSTLCPIDVCQLWVNYSQDNDYLFHLVIVKRNAEAQFREINEAYETIKILRGIK